MRKCHDCEAETPDAGLYCMACGQALDLRPLRVREILAGAIGAITSLELPIVRTLRDLVRGPGQVADAWIAGRRKRYINPLNLLVIVGLVTALTYEPLIEWRASTTPAGEALYETGLNSTANQYLALLCIGLAVPIAVLVSLVVRALGPARPWLEWYVLALYCFALTALVQLMLAVVTCLVPAGTLRTLIDIASGLLLVLTLTWGATGFVRPGWRGATGALAGQVLAIALIGVVAQVAQKALG